jgi:hypothetical protein
MKNLSSINILIAGLLAVMLIVGCAGSKKKRSAVQLRSQRVQEALGDISEALQNYYNDNSYFPKGMATLRDAGYLSIMPDVEREWEFKYYTDADRIMMVEATSRSSMHDGSGYNIIYRVQEESWEGYGITEFP